MSDSSARKRKLLELFAKGLLTEAELEAALQSEVTPSSPPSASREVEAPSFSGGGTLVRRMGAREPQRGEVLGGLFELVELIGRGAMGVVWKARDVGGNRDVCVKLLPPEVQDDETELARVRGMFEKVHALQHEHLCPLYLMGNDSQYRAFLVMKLIDGVTLSSYWQNHRSRDPKLGLERVTRLLQPIAAALDYVHRQNLVHRDVKPANILVGRDGQNVQIVDLGLAAEIRGSLSRVSRNSRDIAGTAPYMAPEQWRGGILDGRADQYALANIAYQMLVGRLPFDCPNDVAWMHCTLNEPVVPVSNLWDHVNAALLRGLAKDKDARFASCAEFVDALGKTPVVTCAVAIPVVKATPPPVDVVISENQGADTARSPSGVTPAQRPVEVAMPKNQGVDTPRSPAGSGSKAGEVKTLRWNNLFVPFCWCPAGQFLMGLDPYNLDCDSSAGQVDVQLTHGFWISQTVVIQELYEAVTQETPSAFRGARRPVEQVSWDEALEFCEELTSRWSENGVLMEGWNVTLPTEAQWEYACRAGTMTPWSFGSDPAALQHYAWYKVNSDARTNGVALKLPNPWGLYDCYGNVAEWCADWGGRKYQGGRDPEGPAKGSKRVIRGGGWNSSPPSCQSASRSERNPSDRFKYLGFRIVCVPFNG